MPTTDRVLSGSITKGSRATLTGSVELFYQGINSKDMSVYYGSLVPRVGSGDRTRLYKHGQPISDRTFDDAIILNNTADDMGGEDDIRLEERINFEFETRNLGQPPTVMQGEPFADALDFDPVAYLQDPSEVMWPVNLWNLGDLPKYEFDGVIEPLDIRKELLGFSDVRMQGRTIRASLVGAASDRPWGSLQIKDTWQINERESTPYLDSPDAMTINGEVRFSMQPFQDVTQEEDLGYRSYDYHQRIYASLNSHNGDDMKRAIYQLNSSSCQDLTPPLQKRAATGFYFGEDAGSIIFGDVYMLGEQE